MRKGLLKLSSILWLLAAAGAAHATPTIGVAVDPSDPAVAVGGSNINADGSIDFFIPLSDDASGTFGIDAGLTSDTCSFPSTCTGGTLDMFLSFSPVSVGPNLLTLDFIDLDIADVNDPWFFLESLEILDAAMNQLFLIEDVNDQDANPDLVITANPDDQILELLVDISGDPFFAHLVFTTAFDPNTPDGTYRNTQETLLATVESVPEPGALILFSLGLAAIVLASRRRIQARLLSISS